MVTKPTSSAYMLVNSAVYVSIGIRKVLAIFYLNGFFKSGIGASLVNGIRSFITKPSNAITSICHNTAMIRAIWNSNMSLHHFYNTNAHTIDPRNGLLPLLTWLQINYCITCKIYVYI